MFVRGAQPILIGNMVSRAPFQLFFLWCSYLWFSYFDMMTSCNCHAVGCRDSGGGTAVERDGVGFYYAVGRKGNESSYKF